MPSKHKISERELIERLPSRDHAAISALYDNDSAAIYGMILRVVRCEHTAEDVMQECFVKIWTSILSYDPYKARLFTWLIRIACNTAIDTLRLAHYRKSQDTCEINEITLFDGNNTIHTALNQDCIGLRQLTHVLNLKQREVIDLFTSAVSPRRSRQKCSTSRLEP